MLSLRTAALLAAPAVVVAQAPTKNIVETAVAAGDFTTLVAAVKAADAGDLTPLVALHERYAAGVTPPSS